MDNNTLYTPPVSNPDSKKGVAVAVLVLGIVSDVLCLFCFYGAFFTIICGTVAIILYLAFKKDFGENSFKLAKAGFICAVVSAALSVLSIVLVVVFWLLYFFGIIGISFLSILGSAY